MTNEPRSQPVVPHRTKRVEPISIKELMDKDQRTQQSIHPELTHQKDLKRRMQQIQGEPKQLENRLKQMTKHINTKFKSKNWHRQGNPCHTPASIGDQ